MSASITFHARPANERPPPQTTIAPNSPAQFPAALGPLDLPAGIIPPMPTERPVISSAKRIGLCTLASRVTGLARDMLLVQTFGLGWVLDRFLYAFQFPNLFRRLFGEGALAAAFVPTFTNTIEKDGRDPAWRLLARTLALLTLALIAVIFLIEGVILAVWLLAPGGDAHVSEPRRLLLSLTALMLPFMLSICVLALFSSILNCVGSFVPAALTPIVLNLGMIAGIVWLGPALHENPAVQIYGVAISVLVAGVAQLLLILPVLRANGVKIGWRWDPGDPGVRRILALMAPVVLGQGVLLFGVFLDAQICILMTPKDAWLGASFPYPLRDGALSAVSVAQRLYQFPLGVLGISIATAALPTFSRLAAREQWAGWTAELRGSLRLALFTGLLAGGMMIVLAEPIVRLLFEYRSFTPEHTARAARVLACYGFGMWAFFAQHIVLRGFYSVGDVRTPLKISCLFVPLNLALSLVLIQFDSVREAAFGISTSLTSSAATVVGLVVLQRRTSLRVVDGSLVAAVTKMLLATAVSVAVVFLLRTEVLTHVSAETVASLPGRAVDALGSLALGCLIFLGVAWLMRLPETKELLRSRRASTPPKS